VGVEAFLAGRIDFLEIGEINEFVLEKGGGGEADSLEAVLAADALGRRLARERVERRG